MSIKLNKTTLVDTKKEDISQSWSKLGMPDATSDLNNTITVITDETIFGVIKSTACIL